MHRNKNQIVQILMNNSCHPVKSGSI